ncbi:DUF3021 domain-containing protein [Arthrobacter sp. Z1-15]
MSLKRRALLLAGIPVLVMTAIGSALYAQGDPDDGRSTIAAGVIIGAVAGASTIYQLERWPLWRQSAVHFALMAVTVLPALFLSGWFPVGGPADALKVVGMFLTVGAVLWSALFLIIRQLERRAAANTAKAPASAP